jgi:malate synthase
VALQYLASWLAGSGAVAIFNLMEDAATAEISRSQIWQWLHNDVTLRGGGPVTRRLVDRIIVEELDKLGDPAAYADARTLFSEVALADDFADFLTLPAYDRMP